jgi:hypothetical protein
VFVYVCVCMCMYVYICLYMSVYVRVYMCEPHEEYFCTTTYLICDMESQMCSLMRVALHIDITNNSISIKKTHHVHDQNTLRSHVTTAHSTLTSY